MSETHGILNFQKEYIQRKLQVPSPPAPALPAPNSFDADLRLICGYNWGSIYVKRVYR
jgi:hypothetical protein